MKKAYTLVELLVVIALMGMMATLAVSSYSAITRGMRERAALATARSLADAAMQRARMDRAKVYIYLFNEVIVLDTPTSRGSGSGVMIAVRPIGRVTQVPEAGFFCDEFSDVSKIYGTLEDEGTGGASVNAPDESASTFRLYNITRQDYAAVREGVSDTTVRDYDLEDVADEVKPREWKVYGFKKTGEGGVAFEVGDLYGQEFAVTRLPTGYFFSSSVPMNGTASLGQKLVRVERIDPTSSSCPSIQVFSRQPDGSYKSIGDISNVKDGEERQ